MKNVVKILLITLVAFILSCTSSPADKSTETADTSNSTNAAAEANFPYRMNKNHDWELNKDHRNTLAVLSVLKAMEKKDYQEISNYTADSIESNIDGVKFHGTKADMMMLNKDFFATIKNIKITPHNWHSVINKNKSEQWVSVWYTQNWEDLKGKADSLNVFNDIQFVDGKIVTWNEYIQHFPRK